jgi:hypothetical protein
MLQQHHIYISKVLVLQKGEKLDVVGNTKISGTLNVGTLGTGTSVNNLGLDVNGNVVSGNTNTGIYGGDGTIPLNTTASVNGDLTFQGLDEDTRIILKDGNNGGEVHLFSDGNAGQSALEFYNPDGVTLTSKIQNAGGDTRFISNNRDLLFTTNTGVTTEGFFIEAGTGNIGIGTETPIEKLDVNGNVIISGSLTATTYYGDGSNLIGIYWSGSTGTNSLTPINSGSVASGLKSMAIGNQTTASGDYSYSEGQSTIASGTTSHAEGYLTKAFGDYSHAEGHSNTASGIASHVEGGYWGKGSNPNVASGDGSHAEGGGTTASGDSSHAEGENTTASNNSSHAEGGNTTASGIFSHAEGEGTTSSGPSSHAEGGGTIASGIFSHAEGEETTASGDYSHSEGTSNTASGIASHVEGGYLGKGVLPNVASGNGSHAEGGGTTASGVGSHAEGENTTASNNNSHAEGDNTLASGGSSHAEGFQTTASGDSSHAEGGGTIASGLRSHAEGSSTTASGDSSHAGGNGSTASGNTSFIHSTNSLVTGDRSVILGGQNITGTTNDTVYVPYLRVIDSVNIGTPNPSVDAGPPINIINNDALYSINAGSGNTLGGNYSMTLGNNLRAIGDGLLVGGTSTNTPIIYGGNSANYSISWGRNVEMYSDATDSLCNIAVGEYIINAGGIGNAVFGSNNTIRNNESCVITGSENRMENSNGLNPSISSSIIGGTGNTITKTSRGAIIGGDSNEISLLGGSPEDSVIIGGSGNTISHNRSVILGGENISSTANDTVYVPNLNIQTTFTPSSSGDTTGSIGSITWDNNYVYVKTNNGWGRSSLDYGF